jgi:secondary thiamine-phosphate synthase enzyme
MRTTGQVKVNTNTLAILSTRPCEFVDITLLVADAVSEAGIAAGTALVFSRHTTAAIVINEAEPGLLQDMERMLERLAPREGEYLHNEMARTIPNEPENGHAHLRHLLLGASETVTVVEGRLHLGTWQRIFMAELDGPRNREVVVQVTGVEG